MAKPIYSTWNQATRLINDGNFSEAIALANSAMQSAESTAEVIYTLHIMLRAVTIPAGHGAIAKGMFRELTRAFDAILREKPTLTIEDMYLVQALYWFPYFRDLPDFNRIVAAKFMELYKCE